MSSNNPSSRGSAQVAQPASPDASPTTSYASMATELPQPPQPTTPTPSTPPIAQECTIPHSNLDPSHLPSNTKAHDWRQWRSKFATIAASYVLAANYSTSADVQMQHAMISPPQDEITTHTDLLRWRAMVSELVEEIGFDGGVVAFHGYRVRDEIKSSLATHTEDNRIGETTTDVLLWEWIRQNDWEENVVWGPHFHILGLVSESLTKKHSDVVIKTLRTFADLSDVTTLDPILQARSVAKDITDHLTFLPPDPYPPFSWFGTLENGHWTSAKQHVDDATFKKLKDQLINAPAMPTSNTQVQQPGKGPGR